MGGLVKDIVQAGLYGPTQAVAANGAAGSRATGLTAAGSTQGTALALAAGVTYHIVSTAALNTGVVFPATGVDLGDEIGVTNNGANALAVYPPTGGTVNNLATNAAYTVAVGKSALFRCISKDGLTWMAFGG